MLSVLINTHLLMAARYNSVARFLFASSACVYPDYRQANTNACGLQENEVYPALPEDGYG
jgi:GDP-L-fucose synthase